MGGKSTKAEKVPSKDKDGNQSGSRYRGRPECHKERNGTLSVIPSQPLHERLNPHLLQQKYHSPPPPSEHLQPTGAPHDVSVSQTRSVQLLPVVSSQDPCRRNTHLLRPHQSGHEDDCPNPHCRSQASPAALSASPAGYHFRKRILTDSGGYDGAYIRSPPASLRPSSYSEHQTPQHSGCQDAREGPPPPTSSCFSQQPISAHKYHPHKLECYPEGVQRRSSLLQYPRRVEHCKNEDILSSTSDRDGRGELRQGADDGKTPRQRSRCYSSSSGLSVVSDFSGKLKNMQSHLNNVNQKTYNSDQSVYAREQPYLEAMNNFTKAINNEAGEKRSKKLNQEQVHELRRVKTPRHGMLFENLERKEPSPVSVLGHTHEMSLENLEEKSPIPVPVVEHTCGMVLENLEEKRSSPAPVLEPTYEMSPENLEQKGPFSVPILEHTHEMLPKNFEQKEPCPVPDLDYTHGMSPENLEEKEPSPVQVSEHRHEMSVESFKQKGPSPVPVIEDKHGMSPENLEEKEPSPIPVSEHTHEMTFESFKQKGPSPVPVAEHKHEMPVENLEEKEPSPVPVLEHTHEMSIENLEQKKPSPVAVLGHTYEMSLKNLNQKKPSPVPVLDREEGIVNDIAYGSKSHDTWGKRENGVVGSRGQNDKFQSLADQTAGQRCECPEESSESSGVEDRKERSNEQKDGTHSKTIGCGLEIDRERMTPITTMEFFGRDPEDSSESSGVEDKKERRNEQKDETHSKTVGSRSEIGRKRMTPITAMEFYGRGRGRQGQWWQQGKKSSEQTPIKGSDDCGNSKVKNETAGGSKGRNEGCSTRVDNRSGRGRQRLHQPGPKEFSERGRGRQKQELKQVARFNRHSPSAEKMSKIKSEQASSYVIEAPSKGVEKRKKDKTAGDISDRCKELHHGPDNESVPLPAKIIVSVGRVFTENEELLNFLKRACGKNVAPFKLLSKSVHRATSKTICEIVAPSTAAAMAIVRHMMSSRLDGMHIYCRTQFDKSESDIRSQSKMMSLKKKALEDIDVKSSKVLKLHEAKIQMYQEELQVSESSCRGKVNNKEETHKTQAVSDKLNEVCKQRDEFQARIQTLVNRVNHAVTSERDLNDCLQSVGVECQRLTSALPIYARREDIINQITSNQVSIILGETGSGKSTQMTQYLYEAGLAAKGQIVCTQPRKVAAMTLAERVASEMAGQVGSLVGFKTGMKKKLSKHTKIVYATDHCLLNECLADPKLSSYSCIIVDEAHERSIYTDILLGMIKACLPERPDLKVVITSATIDPEIFIKYFGSGPEMRVSGRMFPVEVVYTDTDRSQEFENFEMRAVRQAQNVHKTEEQGDILIFLTSAVEIMRCCEEFEKAMKGRDDYRCFPLHGQLLPEEQKKVFEPLPKGIRKVVFATNCAETSITIDGIKYVIDTGVAKEVRYDPKRNISSLGTHVISKSSAEQRKGRAGRTASGKCYRLYSEEGYTSMPTITKPEILRVHLGQAILKLLELGIDVEKYDFVQSPSAEAIDTAFATLRQLGAMCAEGITETGRWISKLPFDPRYGYLIFEGSRRNLLYETVVLASLISSGSNVIYKGLSESEEQKSARSKNVFGSPYGDIFTWLEVYKRWTQQSQNTQSKWCAEHSINNKVMRFTKQSIDETATVLYKDFGIHLKREFSTEESARDLLRKIIFEASISSVCYYLGHTRAGYFALAVERQVHFHPSSALVAQNVQPQWVVYTEFTQTSRDFIKGITAVEEEWIHEAVEQRKLNADFIETAKQRQINLVHREEVGPSVFRSLVGPRYSSLRSMEEELTNAGMATVVVEADRDLGTLNIFSSSDMDQKAVDKINMLKAEVIVKLQSDEDEMGIMKAAGKEHSGFRVGLGQGGSVTSVLMPDQSNKILIKKSSYETTEEDVRAKFGVFGEIKECVKFKSDHIWGFIRYGSHLEAQAAVLSTGKHDYNAAALKIDQHVRQVRNRFEAKLRWCRRPVKGQGTAFIKCPPAVGDQLLGESICLPDGWRTIKRTREGIDLMLHKTGSAEEMDIKTAVLGLLGCNEELEKTIFVNIVRERVEVCAETEMKIKTFLSNEFMRYISKDKFKLLYNSVKPSAVYQMAVIQFDNPVEGFRACQNLQGRLHIGGQRVTISPDLKTSIHIPAAIMQVCGKRFEALIKGLAKYKNIEVTKRQLKTGDFALDIKSSTAQRLVEAREIFQRELEGDIINCGVNDLVRRLLKVQGKTELRKIEGAVKVLIMADDRREMISIYGGEKEVNQAKIKINEYLGHLAEGEKVDVTFKGPDKPPGLMKALLHKYKNLREDLIQTFALSDVIIDFKRQKMSIIGSKKCVDQACSSISEVESSIAHIYTPQREKWMPDCSVCMCPVSDSSELYRLEGCGHSYCLDCLKLQIDVSIDDKTFPVTCAQEDCGMAIVWRDFRFFLRKKWATEEKLVHRSVNALVSANPKKYRFCTTPDCPLFYEVTTSEEGCEFHCPSCFVSICSSCHTPYHAGLTCRMAVSQAELDKELKKWQERNSDKCKNCPGCNGPVEKIEGCNKMHCICGAYFCWLCLMKFDDGQKCYAHLREKHGGYF